MRLAVNSKLVKDFDRPNWYWTISKFISAAEHYYRKSCTMTAALTDIMNSHFGTERRHKELSETNGPIFCLWTARLFQYKYMMAIRSAA